MATFSALLAICAGNSPVTGEFPPQRPVTRSFDVYFDLRPNKRLSKQSWGWWFETPSRPLWRHCNGCWSCTSAVTFNNYTQGLGFIVVLWVGFSQFLYRHWGIHMIFPVLLKQSRKIWVFTSYQSTRFKIQDSNTFIHQNYMISTWIDTLALVSNFTHVSL